MIGAIIGDIVGSRFEFANYRSKDFELFSKDCFFTDDTIMTLAVAQCIAEAYMIDDSKHIDRSIVPTMQKFGRKYPYAGWGGMFSTWLTSKHPKPYNSFGNGAAMRVSACGFFAYTQEQACILSDKVTKVTHNHKEGMKGARCVSELIYLLHNAMLSKSGVKNFVEKNYGYDLNFTCDSIRDTYEFNETCQRTVPQAIVAFLDSKNFEDAIRNAVSIGGDSDTVAAITGSISEAYYGVPKEMELKARTYLDDFLKYTLDNVCVALKDFREESGR